MTLEESVEIAEAVVALQLLVTELQKISAFGYNSTTKKMLANQFREIMDVAATGWVWSTHA